MTEIPAFPSDDNFITQIEAQIGPNSRFRFVQLKLKSVVVENSTYLASITSKKKHKSGSKTCTTAAATTESETQDPQGGYKGTICSQNFKSKRNRERHEITHGDKFICQLCPVGFHTHQGLNKHKFYVHPENVRAHQSSCCGTDNPNSVEDGQAGSNNLEVEVKYEILADPLALPASFDQLATKKITKLQCHHCPQKMHKSQLLMHSASHNNNLSKETNITHDLTSFKCHICSKVFTRRTDLSQHLTRHHKEVENRFPCPLCPSAAYRTCQELSLHLGTQHPDEFQLNKTAGKLVFANVKKHQCPHCPKKFAAKSKLSRHINTHSKQTYRQAPDIQNNQKQSQLIPEQNIQLDAYGQVSTTIASTSKHLICLFCGFKASDSTKLDCHNRSHTGEKPFECKACPAIFAAMSSLTRHIRMNCPERKAVGLQPDTTIQFKYSATTTQDAFFQYKCTICHQKFKSRNILNKHEATHWK